MIEHIYKQFPKVIDTQDEDQPYEQAVFRSNYLLKHRTEQASLFDFSQSWKVIWLIKLLANFNSLNFNENYIKVKENVDDNTNEVIQLQTDTNWISSGKWVRQGNIVLHIISGKHELGRNGSKYK